MARPRRRRQLPVALERDEPTPRARGIDQRGASPRAIAFHPEGPPRSFVLERGLARVYAAVPDGRQATVTFVHENELAGGTAIASHPPRVLIQVVIPSTLTILDLKRVRRLARTESEVCAAVATHLAARVRSTFRLVAVRSLGTIRERVAYDLLEPIAAGGGPARVQSDARRLRRFHRVLARGGEPDREGTPRRRNRGNRAGPGQGHRPGPPVCASARV